jgi:hypothetical protein
LNKLLKFKRLKLNRWLKCKTFNIFNRIQKPIKLKNKKLLKVLLKRKKKLNTLVKSKKLRHHLVLSSVKKWFKLSPLNNY